MALINPVERIKAWLSTVLIVVAAIALVGPVFWLSGDDHGRQAQLLAEARAQAIADHAALSRAMTARIESAAMATKLAVNQDRLHQLQEAIASEASHVTSYIQLSQNAPLEPVPDRLFTRGFVCDWNAALQPDLSGPGSAAAQAAACTDAPDARVASDITETDILTNHTENSATCAATREQLTQLIRWHQKYDVPVN